MKYSNIDAQRTSILENVNIGSLIENISPLTMQGRSMKSTLLEACNSGSFGKILSIGTAIYEARQLQSVDEQLKNFAFEASNAIKNQGTKALMLYAFEAIEQQRESVITEQALATLNELIIESDELIAVSIRAGKLNPFKSLPYIQNVIESCAIVENKNVDTNTVSIKNPVSYFESTEDGVYFRSGTKAYCLNESTFREVSAPSSKFVYLSSIVENVDLVKEGTFEYTDDNLGTFNITSEGISIKNEEGVFEAIDINDFASKMTLKIESLSIESGITGRQTSKALHSACDAIVALSENFDSVAKLDNVYEAVSKINNDRTILVVNENNYHVAVVESMKRATIVESFNDVRDAVKLFEHITNYDMREVLVNEIAEQCKDDEEKTEAIKEHKQLIIDLNEKKKEILEELKSLDKVKDADAYATFEAALQSTEKFIVEQQINLDKLLDIS